MKILRRLAALLAALALLACCFSLPVLAEDEEEESDEVTMKLLTDPSKTTYSVGDKFNPKGMSIRIKNGKDEGTYKWDSSKNSHSDLFSFSPTGSLTADTSRVWVTFNGDGEEDTDPISVDITVKESSYSSDGAYITAYAATTQSGAEALKLQKGDRFNLVLRIADNALASYDDVDEETVSAKINTDDFTFTGYAEVSEFDCDKAEGKEYCSYVLIFRDAIYNGTGRDFVVNIFYNDTARPVSVVTQSLAICEVTQDHTPGIIVRDVNYGGVGMDAGKDNELDLTLFATSGTETVNDVLVSLGLPEGVTLASGSQTAYVGSMSAGGQKAVVFHLMPTAKATGVANITVSISGIGLETGDSVSSSSTIAIPIIQQERFEISKIEGCDSIVLGEEGTLTVTFVNKGKVSIDNLSASISGENLSNPGQSQYLGNINAGTEDSVDFDITADEAGSIRGIVTLTYEDSMGSEKSITKEYSVSVEEPVIYDDMGGMDEIPEDTPSSGPNKLLIGGIIAAAVVAAAAVIAVRRKKKAKALAELGDDDETI